MENEKITEKKSESMAKIEVKGGYYFEMTITEPHSKDGAIPTPQVVKFDAKFGFNMETTEQSSYNWVKGAINGAKKAVKESIKESVEE